MRAVEVVIISCVIGGVAACLFFSYHAPGALELSLGKVYGVTSEDIGLMYTVYSFPNMVLPVLAGYAIDSFGLKPVGFVLLLLITGGSALFAAAPALHPSNPVQLFLVGRFLLGLGGESIITFAQTASNFWFAGERESLSMGTVLAVYQSIGSASAFMVLEDITTSTSLDFANWSVVIFCGISILLLGLYSLLEYVRRDYLLNEQGRSLDIYPGMCCFCLAPVTHAPKTSDAGVEFATLAGEADEEIASLSKTVRSFSALFWLENIVIFFIVTILYTSANFFPYFLAESYAMSGEEAGHCASLIYWTVGIAPFAGALADKIGNRLNIQIIMTTGCILGFVAIHMGLGNPYMLIAWIGFTFSFLEQNTLTILARTFEGMPSNVEGTGYGIMGVFLNTGLIVVPPFVGTCAAVTGSYATQNLIYIVSLTAGLVISLVMVFVDARGDAILNLTAEQLATAMAIDPAKA